MKRILPAACIIVCTAACRPMLAPVSTPLTHTEITNENNQQVLLGHTPLSALKNPAYATWADPLQNSYAIDTATVQQLAPLLAGRRMDIFLGTWCGDSRRELPRMLKIWQYAGADTGSLSLVFVNNTDREYKQSPQHEERGRNIHHVPTFILYEENREIGRIIESPIVSLEKDMLAILKNASYQPRYGAVAYWIAHTARRRRPMSEEALQKAAGRLRTMVAHYGEFNAYGHMQMASGNKEEAINVFRLNTLLFPKTAGVWQTLGDALTAIDRKKEAIDAYQALLLLQPGDTRITHHIQELKMQLPDKQ